MNLEMSKEKIDEYFDSEKANTFFKRLGDKKKIKDSQLERFHQKVSNGEIDFNEFVKKVVEKYEDDKYYFRWINRGKMPQEMFYFFLFDFSSKYGNFLTDDEYEKYANDFTVDIVSFGNYVFNKMNGQGTCIVIHKLNVEIL